MDKALDDEEYGRKLEKYECRWYRRNMNLVTLRPEFNSAERDILSART